MKVLSRIIRWKNVQDIRSMAGRTKIEDTTARQRELDIKRHKFLERIRHG